MERQTKTNNEESARIAHLAAIGGAFMDNYAMRQLKSDPELSFVLDYASVSKKNKDEVRRLIVYRIIERHIRTDWSDVITAWQFANPPQDAAESVARERAPSVPIYKQITRMYMDTAFAASSERACNRIDRRKSSFPKTEQKQAPPQTSSLRRFPPKMKNLLKKD